MCCVWHSSISAFNIDLSTKILVDKIVLCIFATVFMSIQISFSIIAYVAMSKIREIKKREEKFLNRNSGTEIESDDEE